MNLQVPRLRINYVDEEMKALSHRDSQHKAPSYMETCGLRYDLCGQALQERKIKPFYNNTENS
jgi:hypothetical protein